MFTATTELSYDSANVNSFSSCVVLYALFDIGRTILKVGCSSIDSVCSCIKEIKTQADEGKFCSRQCVMICHVIIKDLTNSILSD